jgi:signal transduction histidine kinase
MRLSFSTLVCPSWSLARVIDAAGRLGYDGVELRFLEDDDALWARPELTGTGLAETKRRLSDAGLSVACVDTRSFFHHVDKDARRTAVDEAARSAELAAALGAGSTEPRRTTALGAPTPGELIAPVRRGPHLDGALVIRGGVLDREASAAAALLAERIAVACEHRRLVGELEESRRLAALGSFAAAIAHDIRTPLTSIQMNVQILRGKARLPADDMEYFEIALDELRRLDGHVRELLDYAKPLQLHRETVGVRDLTDDAARTLEPILAERGLHLACEHAGDVPPLSVDPQRIKQVLWNLLENAAKASPHGSTIAVHTRNDAGRVAIDVVDRGSGIAPGDLPRIFEPFFTTRPDGTGLGLAICQKVVRAHAGEIRVHSELATGSTFTVLLPA